MAKPTYITTPIYYVNDVPHIGHAYTTLAADTLARWHRLLGHDTYFLTGTDEHGLKIEQAARKAGVTAQQHADRFSAPFRELWEHWGVSNDDFIRTTEPRHQAVVQEMWRRMEAAGDIYLDQYEGWYSVGDEAYFTEEELVDGKAPSGHEVEWMVEPSYFFRLSKYGPKLLEHLDANPDFVRPQSRFNEVRSFVERGLQNISISRTSFKWGVPVQGDDDHVTFVWVDALTNYISALGGPEGDLYRRYWPHCTHLIGKDILRFHAVYWPCFLMSAGLELPHQVWAHGWWTINGAKMSKTLGNTVDPKATADTWGLDAFRYFLLREVTFGNDGDFSEAGLEARYNGDLANAYGNLLNRAVGMIQRYRDGVVPPGIVRYTRDNDLEQVFRDGREELISAMDDLAFNKALAAIWKLVDDANRYVADTAPWKIAKEGDDQRLNSVLYNLAEALRIIGIWTQPFLPEKAAALLDQLGVAADARTFDHTAEWGGLPANTVTQPGDPLFPKRDKKAKKAAPAPKPAPQAKAPEPRSDTIAYDDFAKLDLRVARITAAEKHPDADRLLKLTVDAGEPEPRTVCAGIAAAYDPADLVGQTAVLLANLAPRKIRGVMSQGMLLAGGEGADVKLATVPGDLPPGTKVS